ncbi:tripartite motif-containing protein 16-like protein [Triplophysa rosa]|uniref:Tripartite motif-containing protein n=1 Tax=Triplophysa rosa TaxID=992332 RepID=A0A9W7TKX1_TRIRA|nr:tripartite motif-containing protein 16-like protein [Triplophysa rosa]XP_057207713.1 tripartite motif-containing protein 16-like protein [Triplophysa rosa]KAI7800785.1 tripartite motif-containing protein [Triplophysa rosa]
MASVSEQLLGALDELDADKLKRFKWHFKSFKRISASDLDKADAPDTVDLMMKRFGPEEAVKITVDILRKMNQNHVAEELEKKQKQAQAEGSTEAPVLAGAESKPIGDKKIIQDWDDMRIDLKITQRMFRLKIQQREKDLEQLREAVKSYKCSAQTAVEDSEKMFTELIRTIERSSSEVTQRFRDQEKAAVSRAEEGLEQLEQEINDLRRRDAELEQLSQTQDHIQFLQSFQSLSAPPKSTEVPNIPFSSFFSFDGLKESIRQLTDKLEDFCKEEIKSISNTVTFNNIASKTRNELQQYYHQLTLDPNTAHNWLHLSERNRVITFAQRDEPYPYHPERFASNYQVLCRESVSGRCYWEVEWSGSVYIAVAYKSISRNGWGDECFFGYNNKSWTLWCNPSKDYFIHNCESTYLPVEPISSRIGVYVDHSAGTLSFYSVSDTMSLIHTVQAKFTQPLYPGFGIENGSTVKLC